METASKTDLMYEILYNWEFVPRPSPKVNTKTTITDGKHRYFMKNHNMETLYELDELTYYIWSLINGSHNMAEIIEEMGSERPDVQPMIVLQTILFFAESGALQSVLEPVEKKRVRIDSAFKVHVVIVEQSKRFLEHIHRAIRSLLHPALLWASIGFIVLVGLTFAGQFINILGDARNFKIFGSSVVGLFVFNFIILAPVTAVHEIAHGVAVVHYGGAPKDMGTGWFYFGPMFYCDATDAWAFTRRKRMMVMLAGNLSTMLIGSVIVTLLYVLPFSPSLSYILLMTAFWCFYTSLWNFAPPFETDGYYILSDLLNMPNLRHDAYDYLKNAVKRALKQPVKEIKGLTTRKKRVLLGYAVLSVVWLGYMAYQSSTLMTYMATDATASALNISSAILFGQELQIGAFIVGLVSIGYFAMMVFGYLVIFASAIKKATVRALPFEAIHDRDLSVFLYLPTQVPKLLVKDLKDKMANEAKKFTRNFSIKQMGPLCTAVLRMGGKKLALVQIKEHLSEVEQKFTSMYQKFLDHNKSSILRSAGIFSPQKMELTNLLKKMARESAQTGTPEAIDVVSQGLKDNIRDTFFLLNSVSGRVWTIELPPAQQYQIQESLLPTLSVEDFSITDLYDRVEDFKKRTIYGFDSLAKLAVESQAGLAETLANPDQYQIVTFFQPVKGRLIFVGRTEQIERNLASFSSLFFDQAWSSYMDNLLSETNHVLSILDRTTFPSQEEIQTMSDAELTVLTKNLSIIAGKMDFIETSVEKSSHAKQSVDQNLNNLNQNLKATISFKVGLLDKILLLNAENLQNLPRRFQDLRELLQRLRLEVDRLKEIVEQEHQSRRANFLKKKQKMLKTYPIIAGVSTIFVLLAIQFASIPSLVAALIPQLLYGGIYLIRWRRFHRLSRYPSWAFNQIQVSVFALAQALHKYVATGDILTPEKMNIMEKT
ncbi:MAG: DUF3267 domain-containing protein [Candidatus Bathyarchaeota archaeon]|nr:MAG: DUF3267 domain-containing protein [Candidatus Bathyarchaeota archaeon]